MPKIEMEKLLELLSKYYQNTFEKLGYTPEHSAITGDFWRSLKWIEFEISNYEVLHPDEFKKNSRTFFVITDEKRERFFALREYYVNDVLQASRFFSEEEAKNYLKFLTVLQLDFLKYTKEIKITSEFV